MPPLSEILVQSWPVVLAFVIGATPFGFLAGKMKGIDIRDHGSGNIGATNVLRTLGKPIGITVLILDVLKGAVPVLIAMQVSESSAIRIATAVAAILGHNYTFWLKFKGGKGIATTGGALLPLLPIPLLSSILFWILTLKTTRYVSVASIVAAITIPVALAIQSLIKKSWDFPLLGLAVFVCLLAIWKHRSNIARLRRGEENRFEKKPSKNSTPSQST
ncbi:MAG: glycerol-3-phosphate 1-O-acyltransferase PlsY [Verrucomicrobiales bacterium]|nr:glycerol-3-phosphate 1-O-acyltransferase PlsY [Verrucomicrobiales bacterium]